MDRLYVANIDPLEKPWSAWSLLCRMTRDIPRLSLIYASLCEKRTQSESDRHYWRHSTINFVNLEKKLNNELSHVFTTTENYMFSAILKFNKRWIKYWTGTPVMTGVHLLCYPNGSVCLESLYADGCFCCGFWSCLFQNVCNYSISRPVSLFQNEYMYVFYEFIFVCVVRWRACFNWVGACLCVFAHQSEERFLYPYCKVGLKWFLE